MCPLIPADLPIIGIGIGIRHMVAAAILPTDLEAEMAPKAADHPRNDVHTVAHLITQMTSAFTSTPDEVGKKYESTIKYFKRTAYRRIR
jgi:hypothetical protein